MSDTRAFSITTDQLHRSLRPASGPTAGRGQPLTLRGYVSLPVHGAHVGTWGPQQESGLGAMQTLSQLRLGGCGLVGYRHPVSTLLPPGNCLFHPFRVGSFRTGATRPSREGGSTTCTCRGAEPKLRGSWCAHGAGGGLRASQEVSRPWLQRPLPGPHLSLCRTDARSLPARQGPTVPLTRPEQVPVRELWAGLIPVGGALGHGRVARPRTGGGPAAWGCLSLVNGKSCGLEKGPVGFKQRAQSQSRRGDWTLQLVIFMGGGCILLPRDSDQPPGSRVRAAHSRRPDSLLSGR